MVYKIRYKEIILSVLAVGGWLIIAMFFWVLLYYNGILFPFNATMWNELYLEFFIVQIIFLISLVLCILMIREEFKRKKDESKKIKQIR